jgi:hypothetical protein
MILTNVYNCIETNICLLNKSTIVFPKAVTSWVVAFNKCVAFAGSEFRLGGGSGVSLLLRALLS